MKMKGKNILIIGAFVFLAGVPWTLHGMNFVQSWLDGPHVRGTTNLPPIAPGDSLTTGENLVTPHPVILTLSPQPEETLVNLLIQHKSAPIEILNETFSGNYTTQFERIPFGDYDFVFTNLGSEPLTISFDTFDTNFLEVRPIQKTYHGILQIVYLLVFFGGISIMIFGAVLWKARK